MIWHIPRTTPFGISTKNQRHQSQNTNIQVRKHGHMQCLSKWYLFCCGWCLFYLRCMTCICEIVQPRNIWYKILCRLKGVTFNLNPWNEVCDIFSSFKWNARMQQRWMRATVSIQISMENAMSMAPNCSRYIYILIQFHNRKMEFVSNYD